MLGTARKILLFDGGAIAPVVEQDTGSQTTGGATSDTATFATATVTGRGVIVVLALKGARSVSSVTDNKSNTYVRVGRAADSTDCSVEMWYAQPITGGASHQITVTFDGTTYCVWGALEASRVKGGGAFLDTRTVNTTTRGGSGSSAAVTIVSGVPRSANELFVAMVGIAGGGADAGIDTPSAWTNLTLFQDYDGTMAGHGDHRINVNANTVSATWTNDTTTSPYAAIIAGFRGENGISGGVAPPTNTVAPAITGTTTEGETLTSSTGTWTGSPVSYTYQWKDDGVAISGAVASTYVLTASEVGATITCTVTAYNDGGSASATSAGVGPVVAAFKGAMVKKAADQTTADYTTDTAIAWDTEVYDVGGWHDNVTNNTRLTVPSGVSYVRVTGQLGITSITANIDVFAWVTKDGDNVAATRHINLPIVLEDSPSNSQYLNIVSGPIAVSATNYFELRLLVVGDASVTLEDHSWFAIEALS